MDELLHHCIRELAFDGDLGCSVSRLTTFIRGFYESHSAHAQNVDDAFCAFIWSLIVQQPTVRVGLIPEGVTSDVWIAPQFKKKDHARGEVRVEAPQLVIVRDAKIRPLKDLQTEFGDKLRVACDSDAIYASITGSHLRFAKLSPMVYSALQIITRGRDKGITVVDLGARSGYDQKTCFYLVKQLLELNLVVKRRHGGVGTHFVIHRFIFEKSPSWKAVREEERKAELKLQGSEPVKLDADAEEEEEQLEAAPSSLQFPPLDARHLSSLPLVKARIVQLLKASKNNMHVSNNMILTLGFANPMRTDRRFFQSRVRDLIQQGVLEKVLVPTVKKGRSSSVLCLRLLDENGTNTEAPSTSGTQPVDEIEPMDAEELASSSGVKMNVTIHRQLIELLEEAGTRGMTLNEIRAEKESPPSHLSDIGVAELMETSGRERRHRYYTLASYRTLVDRENLDKTSAGYSETDLSNQGSFLTVEANSFYDNEEARDLYQNSLRNAVVPRERTKGKGKRDVSSAKPRRSTKRKFEEVEEGSNATPAKRRKGDVEKDDEVPKVPKKRGRPSEVAQDADSVSAAPVPKKRGRPRKHPISEPPSAPATKRTRGASKAAPSSRRLRSQKIPGLESDQEHDEPTGGGDESSEEEREASAIQRTLWDEESASTNQQVLPQLAVPNSGEEGQSLQVVPDEGEIQSIPDTIPHQPARSLSLPPEPNAPNENPTPSLPIEPTADVDVEMEQVQPPVEMQTASPAPGEPSVDQVTPPPPPITPGPAAHTDPPPSPSAAKSSAGRAKVNVSHLRRENELLRVLELMGGITNVHSKELYDTHTALLETMSKAGEPTSAPVGTRADKRTVVGTFNSLEARNKVKQLTVAISAPLGANRSIVIVHLPDIEETKLNNFLASLGRVQSQPVLPQAFGRKLAEPLEYGAEVTRTSKSAAPLQILHAENPITDGERWSKNSARAEELSNLSDDAIRSVLLAERSTLGQLYGAIMARLLRVRELHLLALQAFDSKNPSSQIVSHEKKIISLSFLSQELPLAAYCRVVPPVEYSEEVLNFLSTEAGANTRVQDLPGPIHTQLQIGRSRARSRILDNLATLRSLNIVSPLVPSTSSEPWLACSSKDDHPSTFDLAPQDGWSQSTPMMAPNYWVFHDRASIHHWAASETEPPFLCEVPITTVAEGLDYWTLLHDACLEQNVNVPPAPESPSAPLPVDTSIAKSLRRRVSWESNYILTWHQTQHLKRFIDVANKKTPLDEPDAAAGIERIAWLICAPPEVVTRYYTTEHARLLKEVEKRHRRLKKESQKNDAKASIAKKAAEAREQREKEWDIMVNRVHPEPLQDTATARIKRVRTRFLLSTTGKDSTKWESEILEAIQEADIISTKVLKAKPAPKKQTSGPTPSSSATPSAPPVAVNPPEKSVRDLVADQGPALETTRAPPKKKRKKDKTEASNSISKCRKNSSSPVPMERDYEELAKDACAIIRARCRDATRLDWGAYEQVFPSVPRNTVRQRVAHIRETPANDTYLNRLEDRWYELWMQHRGTEPLPDDYPTNPTSFNLVQHIEFLRKHIDKNALRVGYVQTQTTISLVLPRDITQLNEEYNIVEHVSSDPTWDFVWNATVEEGREKRMLQRPFSMKPDVLSFGEETSEIGSLARSALKMVLGAPSETYDPDRAASLLHQIGEEEAVENASRDLLAQGVLSKLVRDPTKSRPGRHLKISDLNQNASHGNISFDLYQDAASLNELAVQQEGEWREWPLLATDGDSAALIQLVSDDKVDFRVDTTGPQAARPILDWNSKKADDDHIETSVQVKFRDTALVSPSSDDMDVDESSSGQTPTTNRAHGKTSNGEEGCCRRNDSRGVVDCSVCVDKSWESRREGMNDTELQIAQLVLFLVDQAGERGVSKEDLEINTKIPLNEMIPVISKLMSEPNPSLFWVGYSSSVLVAPPHIHRWTVTVQEKPLVRMFPRRWLTPAGYKSTDVWRAGLRAVVGLLIYRPGISLYELRWRLRLVYDKHEIADLLLALQDSRTIRNRCITTFSSSSEDLDPSLIPGLNEMEEKSVYWFLENSKAWFCL